MLFFRSIHEEDHTMKDIIVTDTVPKPIDLYSQAVRAYGFLFTAQIALDPCVHDREKREW